MVILTLMNCAKEANLRDCSSGFPKTFGDEVILEQRIDVYHYDSGNLTFARSILFETGSSDRIIRLMDQNTLSDTHQSAEIAYELTTDNCIKDFRDYQRMTLNDDCSSIQVDYLTIGINGGTSVSGLFGCEKTDDMVIAEAISFFEQTEVFDSVYVDRLSIRLDLME